jgi:hypothetical protein
MKILEHCSSRVKNDLEIHFLFKKIVLSPPIPISSLFVVSTTNQLGKCFLVLSILGIEDSLASQYIFTPDWRILGGTSLSHSAAAVSGDSSQSPTKLIFLPILLGLWMPAARGKAAAVLLECVVVCGTCMDNCFGIKRVVNRSAKSRDTGMK